MGGKQRKFPTTQWSEIRNVNTLDGPRQRQTANKLLQKYWKPVYCYLRRKGYPNEQSKDLTQGFFYEVILGRDLLRRADRSRGKFRTFLLTALDRYTIDQHNRQSTQKRNPSQDLIHLDTSEISDMLQDRSSLTPEDIFNYAWASEILNQVLFTVKSECIAGDMAVHWEVFQAKVVAPITEGTKPLSLAELSKRHRIKDESTASNMIITIKRRFRAEMRRYIRQFVTSESQVEEEFSDILKVLTGN